MTAFSTMPSRIVGERERRAVLAAHELAYNNRYLDDRVRAILPHDLVLLGAPTGMGKTDLALAIAMASAMAGRPVAYFALEAEPDELERRTKYAWLSSEAFRRKIPGAHELNYTDWLLGRCEHVIGEIDREADEWFLQKLGTLWTYYRGAHFDAAALCKEFVEIHRLVDLVVIDHLHYVDTDDDANEATALHETMKAIRDVSLRVGKPVLLVAHLRKRDPRLRQLVPSVDDFHGSSNITKIATQVITIAPATTIESPKWYLAPTFMSVLKDRRSGGDGLVAMTYFDRRTRNYSDEYTLGRLTKGGTEWEQLKPADRPGWARGHRQLELELGA